MASGLFELDKAGRNVGAVKAAPRDALSPVFPGGALPVELRVARDAVTCTVDGTTKPDS